MKRGFTLIELLASMALLALLIVVGVTLVSSASQVSGSTIRRTGLREEARSISDRMAMDFASAVRLDTYQLRTSTSTNSVISLITSSSRDGTVRMQRIDYRVATNGLFRYAHNIGWNDSQDLSAITEGNGELLSPAVGRLVTQAVMNDGSTQSTMDLPSVRASLHPVSLKVGLVLADAQQRKLRNLAPPNLIITNANTWIALSNDDEKCGWRLTESVLRLP